ncbi:unnamed protein product [Miscanthus lutarioriparius]|uniref:F-box protein AT5G49610-like beta-propeller domain-containing protein n=1 Tax=Miscanthus lutarioriparius TaxID=422564 RepID=A0A811QFY9_9POAL|nr:unnamed protein product [Miscanthus lutarioriparius]
MDPERPPPALTSDLLEEILLRVASPADLARASTACVSFRRLIADPAFLRRYRSIHLPLLLGFVRSYGFGPAEAPHPSAAVARAVAFSFDYLPRTTWEDHWTPVNARDGRVLLERSCREVPNYCDLLVCDPLSRRYLLLPPITDDLLASIGIQNKDIFLSGASFIRSGGTEEDTSFSVISLMQSSSRLGVFIFSSGSGCWSVSTSISWDDLGLDEVNEFIQEQCTSDCFYWKLNDMSTVVKLDMNSMQFCTIGLPPGHDKRQIVIVESGESRVAMFSTVHESTSVDYYYTFSQNGSEKSHEWHLKSTIPLPAHYTFEGNIGGPAEGYIFIECIPDEKDTTYSAFFSLEIKSFNIERVGRTRSPACGAYPYFGFPPSMSPRRI